MMIAVSRTSGGTDHVHAMPKRAPLFDPPIVRRAVLDSFHKLDPRHQVRNPVMFIVYVGSILTTGALRPGARRPGRGARRVHPRRLASGSGSRCCSPTSPRRWPKGRGKAQADALRRDPPATSRPRSSPSRERAMPKRARRSSARRRCARATSCWSRPATSIPGDGEVDRRRRLGRRERDHRRERAGHPRERRRPQRASPAARACCPTGSIVRDHRRIPARRSSTA